MAWHVIVPRKHLCNDAQAQLEALKIGRGVKAAVLGLALLACCGWPDRATAALLALLLVRCHLSASEVLRMETKSLLTRKHFFCAMACCGRPDCAASALLARNLLRCHLSAS